MSKLSNKDKKILMIVGMVVVLGGLFWFYVKPAKSNLASAKQQVVDSQANVDTLQQQLNQLTAAPKNAAAKATLADELKLAKAYPFDQDIPATILQVEDIAKHARVELGEVTPDAGTDYAGVTGTSYTINVTGTFFNVQDFIYRLHNRVSVTPAGKLKVKGRLLAVTKADLNPDEAETSTGTTASAKVTAAITAVAFSHGAAAAGTATSPADASSGGAAPSTAAPSTTGGTPS